MKPSLLATVLLAISVHMAASHAASPRIDESALAEMRKGQTTYDEVVRRYGRPNFASTSWGGARTAAYAYGEGWSPGALSALSAALGGGGGDTVVLNFDEKGRLTDYRINQAAVKPGDPPAAPAVRYVEPSFGGSTAKPAPATAPALPTVRYVEPPPAGAAPSAPPARAATGSAAVPVEVTSTTGAPADKPAAVQAVKPAERNDGLPWWLPSGSTRGEGRY